MIDNQYHFFVEMRQFFYFLFINMIWLVLRPSKSIFLTNRRGTENTDKREKCLTKLYCFLSLRPWRSSLRDAARWRKPLVEMAVRSLYMAHIHTELISDLNCFFLILLSCR
jgi:hypothetical protein